MSNLLDQLLTEQSDLTAVERFSRAHDEGGFPDGVATYEHLLPRSTPSENQQFAFQVDLDRCSGCKACVTACHSLNGLDEDETWRSVGSVLGTSESALPVIQHVTTACHHCLEPACAIGCPVNAYEKDPVTGIVRHLDDQCFGCQYCTMTCPYEVPQYSSRKGIVRKCDMCADRLADGEAPACVQACPHDAIRIDLVDVRTVRGNTTFPQSAPDSRLTNPTTRFVTRRNVLIAARPVDESSLRLQHAHWPLIMMLVLTQLSVGVLTVDFLVSLANHTPPVTANIWFAAMAGVVGLVASTLHLGRPQFAFRAVLGIGHSWLSREILAFGVFGPGLAGLVVLVPSHPLFEVVRITSILSGIVGVYCSAKLYAFTGRVYWRLPVTLAQFGLTAAISGAAFAAPVSSSRNWFWLFVVTCVARCMVSASVLRHLRSPPSQLSRTARILAGRLRTPFAVHLGCCLLAPIIANVFPHPVLLLAAVLVSEIAARYLFFAAVSPDRMPGEVAE
ncbi:MAG: dimethyl sulfoxide reductase anchor subunit [Planctomycetaceae bacterium]|nr:dimethyl sulfoxide reductase anchor subunit [Planctomycetaceae bacterium]